MVARRPRADPYLELALEISPPRRPSGFSALRQAAPWERVLARPFCGVAAGSTLDALRTFLPLYVDRRVVCVRSMDCFRPTYVHRNTRGRARRARGHLVNRAHV